jgi:tetratricopeptide (TPR) repeat protein
MSKPMMVTLPFVLMLLDYWPLQRFPKAGDEQGRALNSLGKLIGEKIPFICLTIASCFITFWAQNKDGIVVSIEKINFFKRFSNAVVSYVAYLVNTFWSVNLAVFYPYELSLPLWKVLTSGIVLILITLAVLYYRKKLPFLFVGWFTYLGTLIPVIGLVQVGKQAMADRYTYLPSIGIALMMAWGIPYLIKSGNIRKKILLPAGIAIIISLSVLTWRQCGYWKDSVSLFNHALSVTKDNAPARNSLGDAFFKKGEFSKALYHFDKAISIDRKYAYAFYNRGVTYAILTQYQRAVEDFNEALRLYPTYASAFHDRGIMYGQMGQYKLAIEDFDNAIRIAPSFAYAYNDRGFTYSKIGRYQRAISDYNNAIRLEPYYTGAYINRGVVYLILGNDTQGCPDAQKACELGNCKILEYAKGIGHCRRFNADQIAKEKR